MKRYLCSELMALKRESAEITVNLEEIWPSGAVLEAETAIESGEKIELLAGGPTGKAHLVGLVRKVERHEFGWRAEVEFSPLTRWDIESWRPAHLTDPDFVGDR